jgi:chloramphenicol O-acetyltransferase type A
MPEALAVPRRPWPVAQSPRRDAFHFFRGFSQPFFSVCVAVDVTALKPALREAGLGSLTLATHFVALGVAQRLEPWRARLDTGGEPWLYDSVHASTTVLRPDGSFGFATLRHAPRFADFCRDGAAALAAARAAARAFEPLDDELALIHCTTLPWLHFTQFSHARRVGLDGAPDSCPKLAFGRIDTGADGIARLPLAIDAHHALMDGRDVGEFVQGFEAAMREPRGWIAGGPLPSDGGVNRAAARRGGA